MKRLGLWLVLAACFVTPAAAEVKFTKIDCSASRLVTPPNFSCRSSNDVAGGDFGGGTPSGLFKYWSAGIGAVGSRKGYLYAVEALDATSEIRVNNGLADSVHNVSPFKKPASKFSELRHVANADVVAFTSGDGSLCSIFRKVGPSRQTGYRWVMFGILCGSPDKPIGENELSTFINSVGFR
jgi:hypothetical protein